MQRFVVKNARALLGLDVIASTLPKGRPIHAVDIMAVDDLDYVHLIECKWDVIAAGAVDQLSKYSEAVENDWSRVEQRVAEHRGRSPSALRKPPVLVAIGYRCDGASGARHRPVETFRFTYQTQPFPRFVESQAAGQVAIVRADAFGAPSAPHPRVLKAHYAEARIAGLPMKVRQLFWEVDSRLRNLEEIELSYSGKRTPAFASYRCGHTLFATASVGVQSITWQSVPAERGGIHDEIPMDASTDPERIVAALTLAFEAVRSRAQA